ncbi:MAG: MBL fold metallo-hydrolase [Bacteroidota bacterium]
MDRKKFIKRALILSGLLFAGNLMFRKKKLQTIESYTSNPALNTVMQDWPGTPLDKDNRFVNLEHPWLPDYGQIAKFLTQANPQRDVKKNDTWRIPVIKDDAWLEDPADKIVWLGHASFFIQLSGTRILIDPVYGTLPVGKRFSDLPVAAGKLLNIHYILVSHSHYDHCDKDSLKLLASNNPQAKILTGLKLDNVISDWIENPVHTAGWYQQYQLDDGMEITFLPSRHWSNRSIFDVNSTLWGSFMIQKAGKCIYYGGDSGFDSHFSSIGRLFPGIDVALIGAGAYAPTWFMGPNHQDPYDAVRAFHATGARMFIPFHYGTFDSADEPMGEPEQILNKLEAEGKVNKLKILKLGEVLAV